MTILPSLLNPRSRGSIELKSSDPRDAPMIKPNFLSDQKDIDQLLLGGKLALKTFEQPAIQKVIEAVYFPNDTSDEGLLTHLKKSLQTIYHPVGTCKMGNDDMAVVDSQLRVHGVDHLRVIDASIMPVIVSGNTNACVYMIAEKGADMILGSMEVK